MQENIAIAACDGAQKERVAYRGTSLGENEGRETVTNSSHWLRLGTWGVVRISVGDSGELHMKQNEFVGVNHPGGSIQ